VTQDQDTLAQAIQELREARLARLLEGDIEGMVAGFYAPNVRLLPPDQPALEGRDAVLTFWREAPEQGLINLELRTSKVSGSGDLAYETGAFRRTLRPRHGHPFKDIGKYMVVYRRQADGSYLAEAEMFNSPRGR
jgi:ketosteroid isomerase-like protein